MLKINDEWTEISQTVKVLFIEKMGDNIVYHVLITNKDGTRTATRFNIDTEYVSKRLIPKS